MKFTTATIDDTSGSSLQGYVWARYSRLVALFGEPIPEADGYKVSTEWEIKFDDGTIATIYDWKDTNLYDVDLPSPAEFRVMADKDTGYQWHVGGRSTRAVELVKELLS